MSEFDDPELERMLGRASGAYPDANVAFEVVRGRVRQVKRRRAIVASTAACALLFGAVALAVRGGTADTSLQPGHTGRDQHDTVTTARSVDDTATSETEAPDTAMVENTTMIGSSDSGIVPGANGSSGQSGSNSGKGSVNSGKSHPTTTVAAPTPPAPNPMSTTFSSKGGTVEVTLGDDGMVLLNTAPAAGFKVASRDVRGDRIRIEFSNGTSIYEIQLQLNDGKISSSVQGKG